mgnify:CR=1 FL=1
MQGLILLYIVVIFSTGEGLKNEAGNIRTGAGFETGIKLSIDE